MSGFHETAEKIAENSSLIQNLSLMKDGIISHIYPTEGREQYIGFNPFESDEKRIEAIKAIEVGTMFIAGPMMLETGEVGLAARNPFFIDGEFWGFTTTVFSLEDLIQGTGISSYSDIYYFQLSKVNPNTNVEEFFLPLREDLELESFSTISFPEGNWKLYVVSLEDFLPRRRVIILMLFFSIISVIVGYLSLQVFKKPYDLEELLEGKSNDLIASNKELLKNSELLEKSLNEKTILLSEVHHRVKNNLAIVSGLLELQKVEVDDERLSAIFDKSVNRIISIAMVHELMYHSQDLSSVNVHAYLEKLIPAIGDTMQNRVQNVDFEIDIEEYRLNINQAIPLGLLLNELITNSFKYAFNGGVKNEISIDLSTQNDFVKVRYHDNGRGFPDNIDFNSPKNLGLNLIHAQLQQLDAEYMSDTDQKFELVFSFAAQGRGPHSNIGS